MITLTNNRGSFDPNERKRHFNPGDQSSRPTLPDPFHVGHSVLKTPGDVGCSTNCAASNSPYHGEDCPNAYPENN